MTEHKPSGPEETPKPSKPHNVLDSIFRKDGPMPPARLSLRTVAFLMDAVILFLVANFIILRILWPEAHPGAMAEYTAWFEAFTNSLSNRESLPAMNPSLLDALNDAYSVQIIVSWVYFAIGESFFNGASLGKRTFRLRTVGTITLGPASFFTGIIRAGMKTLLLFYLFPILLVANLIALRFNKRGQTGHDLLSRTAVVDEKKMLQNTP